MNASDRIRGTSARSLHTGGRPQALWPLVGAMAFLALGAFVGGISFVADPSGAGLGARLSWLDETPVNDFLLPGVFLLLVFGIGTLLVMAGLVSRFTPRVLRPLERWIGFRWSWTGTIAIGLMLVLWILYEFTIFPDRIALQPILIGVGALMAGTPFVTSMRAYYTKEGGRSR